MSIVDHVDKVVDKLKSKNEQIKSDGWSTSYYELPEDAKEIQDLIEHRDMNFSIGNIFKACYRLGQKDGSDALYDINKILWFATREKARLEKELNNKKEKDIEFLTECGGKTKPLDYPIAISPYKG